jgi:beta-N-acetylhexosaminidase
MTELGQMIMTGISGTQLTTEESKFIQSENIGGVLLFARNYETPAQLAELVNSIQTLRDEYPLLIAVDQEGGRVQRFKEGFTLIPPMFQIGQLDSPKICFHITRIMAQELNACGVNLNLAPVCDVWNNPQNKVIGDRSFSHETDQVSLYVSSVIRGLQTNGVLGCAKHFPGHGQTLKDSHIELPIVKKSLDEMRDVEFKPFIKAIKSRVEFVMMAHLQVDAIDPDLPTSLSPKAYQLLREELRYSKVTITDDMQMGAIEKNFGIEEAAVLAVQAGADIVEYKDMEYAARALEALKMAKKTKKIKNEHFNQSLARINKTKKDHLAEYRPVYIPEIAKVVNTRQTQVFMEEILQKIAKKSSDE